MATGALFGLSVLLSFIAFGLVAKLYVWPAVRVRRTEDALIALVVPHAFRFVGLSFLVPGVVSASLSPAFAQPAAYGDLIAAVLAIISVCALWVHASWAIPVVWVFNLWGTADLLFAVYQGEIGVGIAPGSLGAAFFIPTVVVPALLLLHVLIFLLLIRPRQAGTVPGSATPKSSQ